MPDLDLIKQAEQGVRDGRGRFLRVKMASDTPPCPPPRAGEGLGWELQSYGLEARSGDRVILAHR